MNWNEYFFNIVDAVALKSKDPSSKVGAVIVNPESLSILSTGWNGFPRKIADTKKRLEDRKYKYPLMVHAEQNAILNAARYGIRLDGSILYVSFHPCHECAKSIIQSGIKAVYFRYNKDLEDRWADSFETAEDMFHETGVEVYRYV